MTFAGYLEILRDVWVSTLKGMWITLKVFLRVNAGQAITIQYPEMRDKIPDGSRGLLFNDEEDCISCRACEQICPVSCIHIEAEKRDPKAVADFTKGGVKKTLDLQVFDIDKSLCCYCGLCSSVCPTECLTHTKEYEYSVFDRDKHVFDYLNYTR